MHSIWQEQMEFPVYPILKRDKKTDILYVGATLKHAIEANFQKEMGRSVMNIEEKSIGDMPELGGMGILKATNMNEFKELCILKNYIIRQHIPCDLEIISETSIQVHPVDIESAYIDAGQVIEDDKPCEKRYIHVFSEAGFPEITKPDILEIRKYKEDYLVLSYQRKLEGSRHSWEI